MNDLDTTREVYVVESLRTPLGSFGGELSEVDAP